MHAVEQRVNDRAVQALVVVLHHQLPVGLHLVLDAMHRAQVGLGGCGGHDTIHAIMARYLSSASLSQMSTTSSANRSSSWLIASAFLTWVCATFMSPLGYTVVKTHPYAWNSALQDKIHPMKVHLPGYAFEPHWHDADGRKQVRQLFGPTLRGWPRAATTAATSSASRCRL